MSRPEAFADAATDGRVDRYPRSSGALGNGTSFCSNPIGALNLTQTLPVLGVGYLGVDVFFLLSGFIITHVHRRDVSSLAPGIVGRYYALKLARLYPVHLLMLLALLAMVGISYSIYMVHGPMRMTLGKAGAHVVDAAGPRPMCFVIAAGFSLLTVAVAPAVHHLVELTARRLVRERIGALSHDALLRANRIAAVRLAPEGLRGQTE